MNGVAVAKPVGIGAASPGRSVRVRVGRWPSGLYFARLESANGLVGFAPFVVRPARLGRARVAVVMPTLTWQAYNVRDDDRDGDGDSWYACPAREPGQCADRNTVRLGRPFLNRGVPGHFRTYDLPFLRWLTRTGRDADYLAQSDLEAAPGARALVRAYRLIIFPGHHEYVTRREYDVVEGYRDLGGNLMFLSANNFFAEVVREKRDVIRKKKQWRDQDRPEAALIGVQFRGWKRGKRDRWVVRNTHASSWVFSGTGLRPGDRFASGSIEIDKATKGSPSNLQVLAEIPNVFGPGATAQMTYYRTSRGAKVFAAGAFTLAGAALRPDVSTVLGNLWDELAEP